MQTTSPSMDIEVSSNFERLLFAAMGKDSTAITGLMESLKQSGSFTVPHAALAAIRADFSAARADETTVADSMRLAMDNQSYLLDPHTAVGVAVALQVAESEKLDREVPIITLATAHPAKFPAAVEASTGVSPALPAHLADLLSLEEKMDHLPNDQGSVQAFVSANTRMSSSS